MASPSWIGRQLNGRYEILEMLGQGGMSAVYKANDPNLRRVVAIKMIHPHLAADPEFVRRFEAEAAAVAQLRHPHLIQVYDFNHHDDTYYIVFEFVPGETLQDRIGRLNAAGRSFELKEVIDLTAKVADGLHYAHRKSLVHRDIKPANIMLNVQGEPILTDFGIAKITGGTQHTATGAVLGTAKYMSPEQIRGEPVDGRTDIYALGATLYEALSGDPPFTAVNPMTVMMMHVTDPLPDIRDKRPDVPAALVGVLQTALAKNASDRYQTAADFAAALRQSLQPGAAVATAVATAVYPDPNATQVESGAVTQIESPPPVPIRASQTARTQVEPAPTLPPPPTIPPPTTPAASSGSSGSRQPNWLVIGGIVGAVAIIALIGFLLTRNGGNSEAEATQQAVAAITETAAAASPTPSATSTGTATATPSPTTTATATKAATATRTPSPTATTDPDVLAEEATAVAQATQAAMATATTAPPTATSAPPPTATTAAIRAFINTITISDGRYVVDYGTTGYTEQLPGQHVHFYWNNISQDQAGVGPTAASWILYGGPRPFTGYSVSDRPSGVTAMCVIVANADHTIVLNTGNCVTLP